MLVYEFVAPEADTGVSPAEKPLADLRIFETIQRMEATSQGGGSYAMWAYSFPREGEINRHLQAFRAWLETLACCPTHALVIQVEVEDADGNGVKPSILGLEKAQRDKIAEQATDLERPVYLIWR